MCPIYFAMSFFLNDTATTEIYTLSLHDALPIFLRGRRTLGGGLRALPRWGGTSRGGASPLRVRGRRRRGRRSHRRRDRKSTRLNSSHAKYLVCRLLLEKKNIIRIDA